MAKKLITLPKGTAKYPWLNVPDTKFGDPKYKLDLKVSPDAAEDVCDKLEDMLEDWFNEVQDKEAANFDEVYKADMPFFEEDDVIIFRTTLDKNGHNKKTGESWENKISFFDAKGKPIPAGQEPKVGGGSILRASCELVRWTMPETEGRGKNKTKNLKVGLKLRLKGVQVIEARQGGGGGMDADDMGFEEEEGYSYDPESFDSDGGEEDDF